MKFVIGENRIEFNEGFKPKSLPLFLRTYSSVGSDEELTKIYDKLNGNDTRTDKKLGKVKRSGDNKATIHSGKESGE